MRSLKVLALLIGFGAAVLQRREEWSTCEIYGGAQRGGYYLTNFAYEPWLPEVAEQCLALDSVDDGSISFHANFTFRPSSAAVIGGPGAGLAGLAEEPMDNHESIPTTWQWSLEGGEDLKASVNYLLSGSAACVQPHSWILSIWLGTFGDLEPNDTAGKTGDLVGTTEIAGIMFDVFRIHDPIGVQNVMWVFQAHETQTSFDGDLLDFLKWVVDNTGARIGCIWNLMAAIDIYGGSDGLFVTEKFSAKQVLADAS